MSLARQDPYIHSAGERGRLVLVNLSHRPMNAWLEAVRADDAWWHGEAIQELGEARRTLEENENAYAVVCYDDPVISLARTIGDGRAPSEALATWKARTQDLLDLYLAQYRRTVLVEAESFYARPEQLAGELASKSGIAFALNDLAAIERAADGKGDAAVDPVDFLLARQALSHPAAMLLVQELEVSSLHFLEREDPLERLDRMQAARLRLEGAEIERVRAGIDELMDENRLLLEQLHRTQEELEPLLWERDSRAVEFEEMRNAMKRKNEKLVRFSATQRALKAEFAENVKRGRRLREENSRLASELTRLSEQLDAVRKSRSWRLTAPLRAAVRRLSGKRS